MPDQMQNEAIQRLQQMYSRAQPQNTTVAQKREEPKKIHIESKTNKDNNDNDNDAEVLHNSRENLIDIIMRDKEKSLIVLLIILLISEKADTTLVLALLYLIL